MGGLHYATPLPELGRGAPACAARSRGGGAGQARVLKLSVAESEKSKGFRCNTTCIICTSSSLMTCNTVQITYA